MKFEIETLLLDDEKDSLEYSKNILTEFLPESMIHTAATMEETLEILKSKPIRLAFLDVELTEGDGFSLSERIHHDYSEVKFVFLTGHVDLGAKSYDYEPFGFLVKPLNKARLERTLQRFVETQARELSPIIAIETGSGVMQLDLRKVRYIAKSGNKCIVHLLDGQELKVSCTLDRLEIMLADRDFFRTHQSFLVPVDKIRQVKISKYGSAYEAEMDDGMVVPVSRHKYSALKEFILRHSIHL